MQAVVLLVGSAASAMLTVKASRRPLAALWPQALLSTALLAEMWALVV